MGFNFRKSFKIGKNFRINMSKSGIGYSVGGKGFRFTHSANGRKTVSSRVPGTGISYSESVSPKKHKTPKQTAPAGNMVARKSKSRGVALLLCILFGYFGIHFNTQIESSYGINIYRNSSIFTEAPMFNLWLNLALGIELFIFSPTIIIIYPFVFM